MKINSFIDHTQLDPFASIDSIDKLCEEAILHDFFGVCVSPYHVGRCANNLINQTVKVISVVGFPYGNNPMEAKLATLRSIIDQVDELDVVINLQALQADDIALIESEIQTLTREAHLKNRRIKWIVESSLISNHHLIVLCRIANDNQVDFLKTSTGVLGNGANIEQIIQMRNALDREIEIKASGGIRTRAQALLMIEAGATRIGSSRSIQLVKE